MTEQEKESCDTASCKDELMESLLAILAEEETKENNPETTDA